MIFDRAIRSLKNQAAPSMTTEAGLVNWGVGAITGISQNAALKVSAVNACVETLTNSISKLPIYIMDSGTKERLSHPLLKLLTERPNEAMTPSTYKKLIESNRLLKGNGYALIVRDRSSARPAELIPLPPDYVTPWIDSNGKLWYGYTHPVTGERRNLSRYDVLHYKAYTSDGIKGISVLERAAEVIANASMAQAYEGNMYRNNNRPSGIITAQSSINAPAKDVVRAEWEKVHMGIDNAFRVAVLDNGMDYKPISMSNKDTQFVESKALSVEDISRFFGVPLYKINAGKQSYSSNEQNGIEYVVGTLHPIVTQYEEEDTYKLLFDKDRNKGLEIRRNMMAELRGDFASRGTWYKDMREIGAFSVDDIRALEDMPSVDGGHTRYASLNYVPLELFEELSKNRNKGEK